MFRAASTRMRPLLMTALSACIGLLPAAISTGIGSQVQRPLATMIVGGMLVGPVMLLLAQIGIAVANRLPNFALTADAGSMAVAFGSVFAGGTGFWDLGVSLAQPIFDGGTLLHRERAAKAAYVQASEQYRRTVLPAFQNVADTLNALQQDADALKAAATARDAAAVTLDLAKKQFQSGYVNYLALLSAEQAYHQAVINFAQAQATRYADTAALFQALGGGWWNRSDLPKN